MASFYLHRWPPFALAVLLGACGGAPTSAPADEAIGTPPSLRTGEAAVVRTVRLAEDAAGGLDVETWTVTEAPERVTLEVPASVHASPEAFAVASAPIDGRIVQIYAHEGERVAAGAPLADIESLTFAGYVADYLEADAEAAYARAQVERLAPLVDERVAAQGRLDEAQAALERATALRQAAQARLSVLGVGTDDLARFTKPGARPLVRVHALRSGTIHEHLVDLGQAVAAHDRLATIVDLSEVLVRGLVAPDEAAFAQAGDTVEVYLPNTDAPPLWATVGTISPALDETNRAVALNVRVRPPGRVLLPGQQTHLHVHTRRATPVLSVPLSAVAYDGDRPVVFVRRAAATFEERPVTLGRTGQESVVVLAGLAPGDVVATSQVFSLKALGRVEGGE